MHTYFAKAERADPEEIAAAFAMVNNNPVMTGLLHSVNGLLAILNKHRQVVSVNDSFLKILGITDPAEALGLRPGEALNCIHADEEPGGCGTGKFCSTCGAAIAIVSSLNENKPVERTCALTASRNGQNVDIALLVKSHPTEVDGQEFLLLFLQDITLQQQRAALERTFFHDVNNVLTGLVGSSEMLAVKDGRSDLAQMIHHSALRLKNEIAIQTKLLQSESYTYQPLWEQVDPNRVIEELQLFFTNHPAAENKILYFQESARHTLIKTDLALLLRILCNMVTNALEATEQDGEVKVWVEANNGSIAFYVWNREPISPDIGRRIFQRNFSTKEGDGRGVGTYSMKLFGEQVLGGKVSFTSSPEEGCIFSFSHPR